MARKTRPRQEVESQLTEGSLRLESMPVVLSRVVHELVALRLRFRALLEVMDGGEYDRRAYSDAFRVVRDRDSEALHDSYFLSQSDFERLYAVWLQKETRRRRTVRNAVKNRPSRSEKAKARKKGPVKGK
jgi:hypothetical protein